MANVNPTSQWLKGQRPSYANTAQINALDATQLTQLQGMLKNLGFYTGNIGDPPGLALAGAVSYFQQSFGFGAASPTFTSAMWYALNYANGMVANKQPMDIGVWNSLAGARQTFGLTTVVDPNTISAAPPGAIGVTPGTQQQQGQAPTAPTPTPQPPVTLPSTGPTGQPTDLTSGYAGLDATLQAYGLGAGSEFDLTSWAHNWLKQPDYDPAVFQAALEQTDQFKTRFGAVNTQRQAAGLPRMTPAEILQYEQTAQGIMRAAGLPSGFYDNWRDFQATIAGGVSPAELQQRVDVAKQWSYNLPPEVKDQFAQWFGPGSDTAIAAYVLDTNKALPLIQHQLTMAEIAGAGTRLGVGVDQGTADTLANLGVDYGQAQQGFQKIDQIRPVFSESVGEGVNLTAEGTGVGAVFGTEAGAAGQIEQRLTARAKALQSGGGAERGQQGVIGAGRAV